MHPITHLLTGWCLGEATGLPRRDRILVTLAGLIPDLDGLGVFWDMATEGSRHPSYLYDRFHHVLAHNLGFGLLLAVLALPFQTRRATAFWVFLSFHLHLLGDLVGSKGPDGYRWPIPYLQPFSEAWNLSWVHQWELKAWPNVAFTLVLMTLALRWSWSRGRSPLECLSPRADARLTEALRARFGAPV